MIQEGLLRVIMLETNRRVIYLDYLRIFAMLSVIAIHVSASRFTTAEVGSSNWIVMSIYNKAVGYAVPIFVMISGALSFRKDIGLKEIYQKKILRILIAYIFWNVFYAASHDIARPLLIGQVIEWKAFMNEIVVGRYHLWYCRMIIGIYILIPALKCIVEREKILKYMLAILYMFSIFLPCLSQSFDWKWLDDITQNMGLDTGKYIFYFLLGFFLSKVQIQNKLKCRIVVCGVIAEILMALGMTYILSLNSEVWNRIVHMIDILIVAVSIAIFLLFRSVFEYKENSVIVKLSDMCFGVYLVHDYFVGGIDSLGLTTVSFNTAVAIPLIVIIVFIFSTILTFLCRNIPYIGKYIT